MEIINEKSFEKARKLIREAKLKKKQTIFTSNDDELNRKILEKEPIDILIINEKGRKDYSKQRNSGFNQVMAKAAKKNKIKIGIDLKEILESKGKEKAEILSRIRQNIKLCNKNNVKMAFIGDKNKHDLKSLGLVLGMPTSITKNLF